MTKQIREVRIIDVILYFILPLILEMVNLVVLILGIALFHWKLYILIPIVVVVGYILLHFLAIGIVLLYKIFAPEEMRDRCRYTPTCSTYMILAIKKYGLLIGFIKGIKRIRRCHPPYGGVDYP